MIGVINQVGSVTIIAQFFWVDLGVGLAVAFIIAALVSERAEWLRVILESRPLAFLGLFSFSIYLIHAPILQVVWLYWVEPRHLTPTGSFFVLVLAAVPIILVVSYGFFRVAERPFLRRRSFGALLERSRRPTDKRSVITGPDRSADLLLNEQG